MSDTFLTSYVPSEENHLQMNGGGAGNRYATVLTYLGAPEEGGETVFPMANQKDLKVKPSAVYFLFLSITSNSLLCLFLFEFTES